MKINFRRLAIPIYVYIREYIVYSASTSNNRKTIAINGRQRGLQRKFHYPFFKPITALVGEGAPPGSMVYGLMKIARVDNPSSGEIPAYGGRLGAYKGGGTMKTFSTKFSEIVQLYRTIVERFSLSRPFDEGCGWKQYAAQSVIAHYRSRFNLICHHRENDQHYLVGK